MKLKSLCILTIIMITCSVSAQKGSVKRNIKADKQYLLYPINNGSERKRIELKTKGFETYFDIEISADKDSIDFWTFMDISSFKGQKLILKTEDTEYLRNALDLVTVADKIISEVPIYNEKNRQQLHFSSKRGWNNDPNGLVYHDGEYHLFYQHNPYGWKWGNMHWGHAVSKDLIHWKELPDALYPDELGTMYSGSAVIDKNNTAGWGKDILVAAYTADRREPRHEVQCIAWSDDNGRTFTKHEGNPVVDSYDRWQSHSTRDPKVFWYEPDNRWVMALYEVKGISIYTSYNLKEWEYQSHTEEFYECPELFELPVDDDPDNKLWVMYDASGKYKLGKFNGKEFTTEYSRPGYIGSGMYAAQTYNNTPDGRRIQIGWGTIPSEGMPFNQMMTFPTEMKLKSYPDGPRLQLQAIEEISSLYKKSYEYKDLKLNDDKLNDLIIQPECGLLHIKCSMEINDIRPVSMIVNGHKLTFNPEAESTDQTFIPSTGSQLKLELIVDVNSIEVFMNDGQFLTVIAHNSADHAPSVSFEGKGNTIIRSLEINELKSIW